MVIRPCDTQLRYTWCIAVWTPVFTQFLHDHMASSKSIPAEEELTMGQVIQSAIRQGLAVGAIQVSKQPYIDIGTSENLARAVKRFAVCLPDHS
jgi:glucose-1-phosphate thymidylyltransferase